MCEFGLTNRSTSKDANVSLWTPDGERPVNREPDPQPVAAGADDVMPSFDDLSPEEQEQAAQMAAEIAETRKQISETPASLIVANHVMGLYELAAIHLGDQPPNLAEAAVAIDAMGAVMEALPGRLGENEEVLRQAIQQLRMAFVELSQVDEGAPAADETPTGDA